MSIKLEVDKELRYKIENMTGHINKLILSGKENLYNDDAKNLIELFGVNELLLVGCKLHKLPTTQYIELPQKQIGNDKIESALFSLNDLN